jgi:outer membrane protein TolC
VKQAAEASAELARRMEQVGNFNKLQRAREQSFYADAALNLARAEQAQRTTRERLTRLLGLWGAQTQFKLPDRLPDLPQDLVDRPDIERVALAQRLDVQGAKLAAEQTARNLGLTKTTRFINVLELGAVRNSSNEAPTQRGWEIGVELPLFDWGGARVARAEGVYMQAVHRAAETAINARSEVREAYGAWRSAYDIARHHQDEIVPLRKQIAEENVLRYNGMLIGVFELLADARLQIASVNAAIEGQARLLARAGRPRHGPHRQAQPHAVGRPRNGRRQRRRRRALNPGTDHMVSRRNFIGGAGAVTAAVTAASVSKVAMAALPEPVIQTKPDTMPPLVPNTGRPYNPVVTLNGWTCPGA